MAHINTFNNQPGATFTDNSLTINTQQNNTQFRSENVVNSPSSVSGSDTASAATQISNIRFSGKRGMKIDLYRVILALHETGFFTDAAGAKPTQKEVFEAFGQMLHADFSDFQKNISQSRLCNCDSDAPTRIFDQLKEAIEQYYE